MVEVPIVRSSVVCRCSLDALCGVLSVCSSQSIPSLTFSTSFVIVNYLDNQIA